VLTELVVPLVMPELTVVKDEIIEEPPPLDIPDDIELETLDIIEEVPDVEDPAVEPPPPELEPVPDEETVEEDVEEEDDDTPMSVHSPEV
jgi:hypothetical protein